MNKMASQIPIALKGINLGERHRHLNSLVVNAYNAREPFETIIALPESSPVDRLFKIDLASKYKHVEYTLKNLQDNDMLYVSRALKCKWLLNNEYQHIINSTYLEEVLYPQMITTAVNKMKHWIHLNLQDSDRCKEFYDYYFEKDGDYAFKFLCKCTEEIILREFPKNEILSKITPHKLKVLCEKTSCVAKLYFEMITIDKPLLDKYLAKDNEYFGVLKCILKTDIDTFMNLTEQHFTYFKRLSPASTKFIMTERKGRFMQKPELYTARILNVHMVAQCLNQEECEELVLKLARAKYLSDEHWFNYKNVEPFVKKLDVDKRARFKKKVFVEKDVGQIVQDWPYSLPAPPSNVLKQDDNVDIFEDREESPSDYDFSRRVYMPMACSLGTAIPQCAMLSEPRCMMDVAFPKPKTILDALFEEYRFMAFKETLFELRKKIKAESSSQNRMYMMLVLVSKSGGIEENINALFHLLMEHRNEPCQVRAAVVRSLVKRVGVWRVTEDIWNSLLIFGQGLGLDGSTPDADCNEGLHAVVIRTLLSNKTCETPIKKAFLHKFSTFTNYSLRLSEKHKIGKPLLNMLLESANAEVNTHIATQILEHAIDTLKAYNLKFEAYPELINTIKDLVKKDQFATRGIVKRLYDSKLGRKQLFKENFDIIQTDASYTNALKQDITVLTVDKFLQAIPFNAMKGEQFSRKVSVYFTENEGLSSYFLTALRKAKIHKRLARPLAYLIGPELKSYLLELDSTDEEAKRFSALVRANAHVARPDFDLDSFEICKSGAKLIANKVLKCKTTDIDDIIVKLLTWKRTARLAIILAQRTSYEAKVFEVVAKIRPTIAIKTALTYFRRKGERSDPKVWEIVKPLIVNIKVSIDRNQHLLNSIKKVESVPLSIRAEYAIEVFKAINKVDFHEPLSVLCHIMLLLPNIGEDFIEAVLCDYGEKQFTLNEKNGGYYMTSRVAPLFLNILGKYLLLCKTEETQNKRFEKVGQLYLNRLKSYWESAEKRNFSIYLNAIISSFRYNKAFLDDEYVSPVPVIEKFIKWMRGILPMEKHFSYYATLHLTMLHYKAVRQLAKQMPEMLTDKKIRSSEGYKIFGEIFGQYAGKEAQALTKTYFDSIVLFYGIELHSYIYGFQMNNSKLIPYVIKGILEVSDGIECMIAVDIFNRNYRNLTNAETEDLTKRFEQKNRVEIQFLLANHEAVGNEPYTPYFN